MASTASQKATPGAWPSLVTQFSAPSSCSSIFKLVESLTSLQDVGQNITTTWTSYIFTSDQADPRFSACQPPGWEQRHLQFSPGVCPRGWGYFDMTVTSFSLGDRVPGILLRKVRAQTESGFPSRSSQR